jgi:hypothetical protein
MDKVKVWDVITRRTRLVERHGAIATCGDCGRAWDDSIPTSLTPAPAGRCPFEDMRRLPGYGRPRYGLHPSLRPFGRR